MRYAQFRSQGFFVGSGVVEAGCKTINRTVAGDSAVDGTRKYALHRNLYARKYGGYGKDVAVLSPKGIASVQARVLCSAPMPTALDATQMTERNTAWLDSGGTDRQLSHPPDGD